MDLVAERGIAAHWAYKHGGGQPSSAQTRAHAWIANLVESSAAGSSLEFLENVKVDLFPDEVYLFTPEGRHPVAAAQFHRARFRLRACIPTSATTRSPRAWTRSWCRCAPSSPAGRAGRGHHRAVGGAAPQWLEFVATSKARTAIRHQLKQLQHEDAVELGHRMLDRALEGIDTSLDWRAGPRASTATCRTPLPAAGGAAARHRPGNRMPAQVARSLARSEPETAGPDAPQPARVGEKILITGAERGVVSFANRCTPIPGDEIMGFHTAGKGIVVHRMDCPTSPTTASRPSAGCRSAGIVRSKAISRRCCGSRSTTTRACWRRSRPRSRRPNRTSTASTTWSAMRASPRSASRSRSATASISPR